MSVSGERVTGGLREEAGDEGGGPKVEIIVQYQSPKSLHSPGGRGVHAPPPAPQAPSGGCSVGDYSPNRIVTLSGPKANELVKTDTLKVKIEFIESRIVYTGETVNHYWVIGLVFELCVSDKMTQYPFS